MQPLTVTSPYEKCRVGNLKGRGGEDIAAPMHMVIDYEPCDECRQNMAQGFTLIEATSKPNAASNVEIQRGVYPTGRYAVLRREAAERIFSNLNGRDKGFVTPEIFEQMISCD